MQQTTEPQPWPPAAQATLAAAPTAPPQRVRMWPAILALFFLAAFIPESVVTASTSPLRVATDPLVLVYIIAFYGSANVLIREVLVRGKRGWPSLILCGLAFGIVNEGVIAGTWYHVAYTGYAFIGGVDVMWAVGLTIFHAVFSVAVPIALVDVLFPQRVGQPWLGRWGFVGCWLMLGLLTLGGAGMHDAQAYRLIALAGAIVLVIIALVLPATPRRLSQQPAPRLGRLRWSAFGLAVLHDGLLFAVPAIVLGISGQIVVSQFIDIAIFLVGWAGIVLILRRWTARGDWGPRHTLAVITGGIIPGVLFNLTPPALALFAPLFALPFVGFLIWATRYVGKIAPQHP